LRVAASSIVKPAQSKFRFFAENQSDMTRT